MEFGCRCAPQHLELAEGVAPLLKSRDPHVAGGELQKIIKYPKASPFPDPSPSSFF